MPYAHNAPPEEKAKAILTLAEFCVRENETPNDLDDGDKQFMNECARFACRDLKYLRRQAAATGKNNSHVRAWHKALDKAHSMRCVVIDRNTKDDKRQHVFRCDACGQEEKWCGMAIDLAGTSKRTSPDEWLCEPASDHWPTLWKNFETDYLHDKAHPEQSDMGRFYLGRICHRKAQLTFVANTMVQEVLYGAKQQLPERDLEDPTRIYTFDEEEDPERFIDRKEQLESCIRDDGCGNMPDILIDAGFWRAVDEHRAELNDHDMRQKAAHTLAHDASASTSNEMSRDDDESDFVLSDEETDEGDEEHEEVARNDTGADALRRGKRLLGGAMRTAPSTSAVDDVDASHEQRGRKWCRVVLDDDEDDEEVAMVTATARPPQRRSRRVQKLPPTEECAPQVAVTDQTPVVPRNALERRHPPTSAVRVATAMRIPRADGTTRLPSRQAVLLDMIRMQGDLVLKGENAMSARVGAAVLTIQELLELVERGRVGQ